MRLLNRILRSPVISNFNRSVSSTSGLQCPINDSVFSHVTNKEITLGFTNVYSEDIIKGAPDPNDPKLIMQYTPDCFRYELKEPECMDDFVKWTKQYHMYDSLEHQLRVLDLGRFESMLTGAQQDSYERRLLILKLIEIPYILDDMAEKLVGSKNPAAERLAVKLQDNAIKIMCGEPWTSVNVSEYAKDCPVEAELCREYDDAFVHMYNECKKLMSPKLLKGFQDTLRHSLESTLLEYENLVKHLPNKTFASKEEFVKVKSLASLSPLAIWTTLDEQDMIPLAIESPLVRAMSLIAVLENDVVSAPKEMTAHNPYNVVLKFMRQGLSLRDASLKVMHIRNELTRSLEMIHNMMDKDVRQSLQKGMRMEVALDTYQHYSFRQGWADNAATVDLYWPKDKLNEWRSDQTVLGSHA